MPPLSVPPATGGEISDEILERACIPAADGLIDGSMTLEQGALIQLTAAALFREVLQWRRRSALARDVLSDGNVILLHGAK